MFFANKMTIEYLKGEVDVQIVILKVVFNSK